MGNVIIKTIKMGSELRRQMTESYVYNDKNSPLAVVLNIIIIEIIIGVTVVIIIIKIIKSVKNS